MDFVCFEGYVVAVQRERHVSCFDAGIPASVNAFREISPITAAVDVVAPDKLVRGC